MVGGSSRVSLGVVSGTWTRVPCARRGAVTGRSRRDNRLAAHSLVQLNLRQGSARGEHIAFGTIEVLLPGRTAGGRDDVRRLAGLGEVGQDAVDRSAVSDSGDQLHRLPRPGVPQRDDLHSRRAKGPRAARRAAAHGSAPRVARRRCPQDRAAKLREYSTEVKARER
jgi:hypothetical protein